MSVMNIIVWAAFLLYYDVVAVPVAQGSAAASSNCKTVQFSISATAQNRNITGNIPTTNLNALLAAFQSAPLLEVSGTQTLAGTFCKPTVSNDNNRKIQVLFGSITANRDGWQAEGGLDTDFPEYQPERYSWTQYMNDRGYATLAMDRLGTGRSSHPEPILVAQAPYEYVLHIFVPSIFNPTN